jgi:hypothetical protein
MSFKLAFAFGNAMTIDGCINDLIGYVRVGFACHRGFWRYGLRRLLGGDGRHIHS